MSRFKVFNPADYKMVNGKVVPKYKVAGTVKDFEEVQVMDASGSPYTTARGNLVYDVSLGGGKYQRIYKSPSGEVLASEVGTKDLNNPDPKGQFAAEFQHKYYKDSKGAPYSIVTDKNGVSQYGPSYGGYEYKKEGWEGERTKHLSKYEALLNDSKNNDMVDAMYNEYKNIATQQGQTILDKEKFKEILIRGQRHNALIRDVYGDEFALGEKWDKSTLNKGDEGYRSQVYRNTMNALGETPMSEDETIQFQMAFLAAYDQANQPEFQERFVKAGFDTEAIGDDSSINDLRGGKLSKLDSWYGNTTAGYFFGMSDLPEPEEKEEDPADPEKVYYCVETDSGKTVVSRLKGEAPPAGATSGPSDQATAQKVCDAQVDELQPETPAPDTWFGNDVRNYITALGQKQFKGRPGLFQVTPAPYGYALESPDTLIAATTGMANQYNTLLENTMAGPAAAAASLGAQGTFLDQLSQDISGVQTRNLDRLNTAYGQRAQIAQNVDALNTQARKQFLDESNIYGQERVNAMNKYNALVTNFYNKGEENRYYDELLRYNYPQATYPNRMNMGRTWDFSGRGKDPLLPDISGTSANNQTSFDYYDAAYQDHYDKYGNEELAHKYAQSQVSRNKSKTNQTQGYAQAAYNQRQQQAFGQRGGIMKFGANFTTPWGY